MCGIEQKVVVIIDAGNGIGAATAKLLASRGAKVVVGVDNALPSARIAELSEQQYRHLKWSVIDACDEDDIDALVWQANMRFGRVDVIINEFAIAPRNSLAELDIHAWNRSLDVGVKGLLYSVAAGLPIMKEQGAGQFIHISWSVTAIAPNDTVAAVTAAAIREVARGLDCEYPAGEIHMAVVAPAASGLLELETACGRHNVMGMAKGMTAEALVEAAARAIVQHIASPGKAAGKNPASQPKLVVV